jgi:5'-nucleotidase/UDP-sugar diphosphatase
MRKNTFGRPILPALVVFLVFLFPSAALSKETDDLLKLTILYMNDPHAYYEPYKTKGTNGYIGGFAKAMHIMREVEKETKAQGRHDLVFLAGDLLMGTPFSMVFKGKLGVDLMNHMKFDAMTVGNHEFDYDKANLMSRLRPLMEFPLLSENIRTQKGDHAFDTVIQKKYAGSKTRVIIFGLTTAETPRSTLPGNVKGLVFNDPIDTARKLLESFNDDDLIIALTHIGILEDRKLAAACPKIDIIIGGHSHTKIFTPEKVGETLICQAGAYAEFVGRLDVDASNGAVVRSKGELIRLGPAVKEDKQISSLIADHKVQLDAKLNEIIGRTDVFLDGRLRQIRSNKQTNLGRLITYAMAETSRAEVAFINGGAVRKSLHKGTITSGEIFTVLPFQDTLIKMNLQGKDLEAALQKSLSLPEGSGGKLQSYGMSYREETGKVTIDKIGMKDFSPAATYSVATNNFLYVGGDGYTIFGEKGMKVEHTRHLISDLVIEFILKHKIITESLLKKLDEKRSQNLQH